MDFKGVTHVTQNSNGTFGLCGSVPVAAGLKRIKDGKPPTKKQAKNAAICGPRFAGLTARVYDTAAAAVKAVIRAKGKPCDIADCSCRLYF